MTKKKRLARLDLASKAERLADEVVAGKWDHIPELKSAPIGSQFALARELERRCPGHTIEVYLEAFGRAWWSKLR
ncbi:hypothetical protein ETAA8_08520 [Anatilimnocola aggregata]|uniref:Uncharacterized protein n=1 Tax=Anatilimnocola aggregata TaxID=2528021 RepID=A0A517Y6C6_9BACT|nr:hypothetical protein ETAA8_08520 [Anatilimnocola aggregata]